GIARMRAADSWLQPAAGTDPGRQRVARRRTARDRARAPARYPAQGDLQPSQPRLRSCGESRREAGARTCLADPQPRLPAQRGRPAAAARVAGGAAQGGFDRGRGLRCGRTPRPGILASRSAAATVAQHHARPAWRESADGAGDPHRSDRDRGDLRRADAAHARDVPAPGRLRREILPALRGPGPVPSRARHRLPGAAGRRRARGARQGRLQPAPAGVRQPAQASRDVALVPPPRPGGAQSAGGRHGLAGHLVALPSADPRPVVAVGVGEERERIVFHVARNTLLRAERGGLHHASSLLCFSPFPVPRSPFPEPHMSSPRSITTIATLGLIAMTAVWGSTFVLIKNVLTRMPVADFLAVRFAIAALAMLLLFGRAAWRLGGPQILRGLLLGTIFGCGQLLQTWGLSLILPSVSGFVTGMYVVFTPILALLLLRQRMAGMVWLAVLLSTAGLALLSLNGVEVDVGVWLTLASAALYALHIVLLGQWSRKGEAFGLSAVQMLAIAVVCMFATLPRGPI